MPTFSLSTRNRTPNDSIKKSHARVTFFLAILITHLMVRDENVEMLMK